MTALLTVNLPLLAGAPNGIKKLRELILELAVRGKLVPQDPNDEPASELLKRIAEEKARLVAEGKIKKQKPLTGRDDEAPTFELPAGWAWARLSDVVNVLNGRAYKKEELLDAGTPVLRVGNLFTSNNWYYSNLTLEEDKYCNPGDLLFAWSASFGPFIWQGERSIYHYHIWKLDFYAQGQLSKHYLYNFLLEQTQEIKAAGHGVSMVHMTKEKMEKLAVPVPPLAEQHRIVAKVDELMALCDRLEARQTNADSAHAQLVQALLDSLTQARDAEDFAQSWQRLAEHFHTLFTTESSIYALKQTLLQLAVMGKLVPQDPSDEPASELLRRIAEEKATLIAEGKIRKQKQLAEITEEEKLFELAPGWEWSRLGEQVIESGAGWSPSCEPRPRERNDWGVLKVSAVSWGVYRPEENKALPVSLEARPEHEVAEGDFLVSRANTAELVARSVVVDSTPSRLMLSDKIVRLRLTKLCDAHYLNLVNSATHARQYYARVAGGTSSSMKNVSREQILSLPIAVPPLLEQHRIVAKVDQLMSLCDQLKARLNQARQVHEQLACALVEQAVA
ncbi:restriction endonuclease subunit S [Pseudomonas sp. PS02288]|uniref:restriction endonuclease subunit S n=1 Tax=Pseudomonas sp. PS02288 TaxID=2991443 RepID=UPI00249B16E8|nr:restriction endonuclease subunit S [Pseudomonas sp. PS02288]